MGTASVLLSIGMLEKVWRKASSARPAKTWQPLRKTTKRLALRQQKAKERRKAMVMSSNAGAEMRLNSIVLDGRAVVVVFSTTPLRVHRASFTIQGISLPLSAPSSFVCVMTRYKLSATTMHERK